MRGIHLSTGLRAAAEMVTGDLERSSVSASGSDVCASERMSKPGRRFSTGKPHARRLNCAATRSRIAALWLHRRPAQARELVADRSRAVEIPRPFPVPLGVDAKAFADLDDARRQIGDRRRNRLQQTPPALDCGCKPPVELKPNSPGRPQPGKALSLNWPCHSDGLFLP